MNKRDPSTIFRIYSYIRNKSEITHGPPRGSAGFDPAGAGMPMPEDRLTSAFGRSTREANMSEAKSAREKYRSEENTSEHKSQMRISYAVLTVKKNKQQNI